jgi:hypothetical protein
MRPALWFCFAVSIASFAMFADNLLVGLLVARECSRLGWSTGDVVSVLSHEGYCEAAPTPSSRRVTLAEARAGARP